MNGSEKHLSDEQIERLVADESVEQDLRVRQEALEEIRSHVATCTQCQSVVQMHSAIKRGLESLRLDTPGHGGEACPSAEVLREIAAGVKSQKEFEKAIDHAATCDRCGPILREATEEFADELTSEEKAFLAQLPSAQPAFQEALGKTLSQNSKTTMVETVPTSSFAKSGFIVSRGSRWLYAAIAASMVVVLVTAFGWIRWHSSARYADALVVQSYAEQRTIEMRISGAQFSPMSVERGEGISNVARPAALLEAELVINKNLRKHPGDPVWLRAKARADLLDGNFDSAIQGLEKAVQIEPNSADILTDLGSAHFELAEAKGSELEYGTAIEFLSQVLRENPKAPVALFNRAIALERMKLYEQAIEDWEDYLRIDGSGGWADDVRKRLDAVRSQIKQHSELSSPPLYSPNELLENDSLDRRQNRAKVDLRIEEYLNRVVRDWLPDGFHSKGDLKTAAHVLDAMRVLAEVGRDGHNDPWLSDFLSETRSLAFGEAVATLSKAARANDQSDYESAIREAETAEHLFERSGNPAGRLRAKLEMAFAYHFSRKPNLCLNSLSGADVDSKRRGYRWLLIQFQIEKSICVGLGGDLGSSARIAHEALAEAKDARYGNVYLRAVGLSADLSAEIGDVKGAWQKASDGLGQFWSGPHSPMAGYNLYTDLDTVADTLGQRFVQVAIWKEALKLIDTDSDLLLRAMAHRWMAGAAYSARMSELSESEFAEASRLFASAPQTDATRNDRAEAEIWLARLETQRGETERAGNRLQTVEKVLSYTANNFVAIRFYEAQCELELSRNNLERSEESAWRAIQLAELSLRSLRSETDRVAWKRETSDCYRALVELRIRRGDLSGALEEWEWYKGAFQRPVSGNENRPDVTPDSVQKSLPTLKGTSILSIALLPNGIATWLFDERGVTGSWKRLDPSSAMDLARRFSQLCSDPHSDLEASRFAGHSLYELLIGPSVPRLEAGRELVIELDDRLGSLPIEALVDTNWHYLGETTTVVSSPGLYVRNGLRNDSGLSRESTALVLAVPTEAGPQTFPLPDALEEVRAVARNFSNAQVLIGNESKTVDLSRRIAGSEIFHFAGHSMSVGDKIGLVLGGEIGNPVLFDIGSLDSKRPSRLKLVVLSSCSSAVGTNDQGNGPDTLVGGFLKLGVAHVVGSRWQIDSATTAKFMNAFYLRLLEGESAALALKGTEAEFRSNNKTAHPFYWSAFGVFGR